MNGVRGIHAGPLPEISARRHLAAGRPAAVTMGIAFGEFGTEQEDLGRIIDPQLSAPSAKKAETLCAMSVVIFRVMLFLASAPGRIGNADAGAVFRGGD